MKTVCEVVRRLALALVASTATFGAAEGVTLTVSQIQQRYPWNGLVDVDYTITCEDGVTLGPDDNIELTMIDRSVSPAVTNRAVTFLQAPLPMTAGSHRITWDANADGVTNYTARAVFQMNIMHYTATYMVIDVSGGPSTNMYPVSFLNGEPGGGFNKTEYKTDKIVLRRIHPGSYMAGSPVGEYGRASGNVEKQHRVAISKPFYVGVFKITQKQYEHVMGSNPTSALMPDDVGDTRPVAGVSYNTMVRGGDWPTQPTPGDGTFIARMRAKCKAKNAATGAYDVEVTGFDLPTEFQWEYACRAGTLDAFNTTNAFPNTKAGQDSALNTLGRYKENGGSASPHLADVGSYAPNLWGLYDMHGNLWEMCREWYLDDVTTLKQFVDPKGPDTHTSAYRVQRGGAYNQSSSGCRSANRGFNWPAEAYGTYGFRLIRETP